MDIAKRNVYEKWPAGQKMIWCPVQNPELRRAMDNGDMFLWSRDRPIQERDGTIRISKSYFSCSLAAIIQYIYSRPPEWRNVFEIIRCQNKDGSNVPCKLYIDCDVEHEDCPNYDASSFVAVFEKELREFLGKEVDPIFLDCLKTPLLAMKSLSPKKWSMHYIMNGAMFYNNFHVGAIIRRFHAHVVGKYGHPDKTTNPFYYNKVHPDKEVDGIIASSVIDNSVYTIHRPFRILGNCKYGKNTHLHSTVYPADVDGAYSIEAFRAHTIQDPVLAQTCPVFSCTEDDGSAPSSRSVSRVLLESGGIRSIVRRRSPNIAAMVSMERTLVSYSVLRTLIDFIEEAHSNVKLSTSGYVYKSDLLQLVLQHAHTSRYCYTKEADHSTSGIFFVINMRHMEYSQRCYKSNCKRVRAAAKRDADHATWNMPEKMAVCVRAFLRSSECCPSPRFNVERFNTFMGNAKTGVTREYAEAISVDTVDTNGTTFIPFDQL